MEKGHSPIHVAADLSVYHACGSSCYASHHAVAAPSRVCRLTGVLPCHRAYEIFAGTTADLTDGAARNHRCMRALAGRPAAAPPPLLVVLPLLSSSLSLSLFLLRQWISIVGALAAALLSRGEIEEGEEK